jgi:hypothetical protein
MSNYAKYFSENRYKSTYHLGDRVRGRWNGIPFSGTVQIDTLVDEYDGPYVIVYSDLPIKDSNNIIHTMIKVKPDTINRI